MTLELPWPPSINRYYRSLRKGALAGRVLISEEGRALFPVEYVHRELTYLLPGQRNAVAYGQARLDETGQFEDARILFSRPHRTATLRGLVLEGHVKEGTIPPGR